MRCASMWSEWKGCRTAPAGSCGSRTRFALLDHLQLRPFRLRVAILAGGRPGRRPVRGVGIRVALGENHALTGLTRVYAQDRPHRHLHREADAAEAGLEADEFIAQFEHLGRGETHVEDDFAVLYILTRHGHALGPRVHEDVRGLAAVRNPLVQGAKQIGAPRLQCRMPRSASLRQERNVERAKIEFMYLVIGAACTGSSMP